MEMKEYLDKKQFLCRHFECCNCPMKTHKLNNHAMSCTKFELENPEIATAIVSEYWDEMALPLIKTFNHCSAADFTEVLNLINDTRNHLNEIIMLLNDKVV